MIQDDFRFVVGFHGRPVYGSWGCHYVYNGIRWWDETSGIIDFSHAFFFKSKFQPFRFFSSGDGISSKSVQLMVGEKSPEERSIKNEIWVIWLGELTPIGCKQNHHGSLSDILVRDSTDHTSLVSMRDFEMVIIDFSPRFPNHLFPSMYNLICLKGSEAMFGTWLVLHFWQLVRNYGWNDFANGIPSRILAWQMFFFFFLHRKDWLLGSTSIHIPSIFHRISDEYSMIFPLHPYKSKVKQWSQANGLSYKIENSQLPDR